MGLGLQSSVFWMPCGCEAAELLVIIGDILSVSGRSGTGCNGGGVGTRCTSSTRNLSANHAQYPVSDGARDAAEREDGEIA